MSWASRFAEAIREQSIERVIHTFKSICTEHANTPKQAEKMRAVQIIKDIYKQDDTQIFNVALELANSSDAACEEIGLILLAERYSEHRVEIARILRKLSDSADWEVREWAASACSIVLTDHFDEFLIILREWVRDESANVRRCVAVAVKYVSKQKKDEYFAGLVELIEPLLFDKDPYVKKNLGAFAIGDGLLKHYPDKMREKMKEWVRINNEQVRTHLAMVFTSTEAAKHFESMKDVFKQLKEDQRPSVAKAVMQAETNLTKRLQN